MDKGKAKITKTLKLAPIETVSLAVLIGVLLLCGIVVFLWMAADQFKDKIGMSVGFIFLAFAGLQVLFAVLWLRSMKRQAAMLTKTPHSEKSVELKAL